MIKMLYGLKCVSFFTSVSFWRIIFMLKFEILEQFLDKRLVL
jgi:hypothetical protein